MKTRFYAEQIGKKTATVLIVRVAEYGITGGRWVLANRTPFGVVWTYKNGQTISRADAKRILAGS